MRWRARAMDATEEELARVHPHSKLLLRCRIEVFRDEDAIVIPKRAVLWERGQSFVFRIEDGKAMRRDVVLGIGRENEVTVQEGLASGDQIVTVGNKTLEDGTEIEVVP